MSGVPSTNRHVASQVTHLLFNDVIKVTFPRGLYALRYMNKIIFVELVVIA